MKFSGIAASAGVAIGPIFRFEREELMVRDIRVPPERADAEVARFHDAIGKSRYDLEHIRDGIAHELGDQEAAIYA